MYTKYTKNKGVVMNTEIRKLMRANDFDLIRSKKHDVWQKAGYSHKITTSKTPSNRHVLYAIKRDIRRVNRMIGKEGINYA